MNGCTSRDSYHRARLVNVRVWTRGRGALVVGIAATVLVSATAAVVVTRWDRVAVSPDLPADLPAELQAAAGELAVLQVDALFWSLHDEPPPPGIPVPQPVPHARELLETLGEDQALRDRIKVATAVYAARLYDLLLTGEAGYGGDQEWWEDSYQLTESLRLVAHRAGVLFATLDASYPDPGEPAHEVDTPHSGALRDPDFPAGLAVVFATDPRHRDGPVGPAAQAVLDRSADYQTDEQPEAGWPGGLGRGLIVAVAVASVYYRLAIDVPEQLPPELEPDGDPVPPFEWSEEQQAAWQVYVSNHGAHLKPNSHTELGFFGGYSEASEGDP